MLTNGIYYYFYFQDKKHETQWVKSFVQLGYAASSGAGLDMGTSEISWVNPELRMLVWCQVPAAQFLTT